MALCRERRRPHPRTGDALTDLNSGMTSTVVAKNVRKSSPSGTRDPSPPASRLAQVNRRCARCLLCLKADGWGAEPPALLRLLLMPLLPLRLRHGPLQREQLLRLTAVVWAEAVAAARSAA